MVSFSTDDIRPQDRFDHWREERSRALFGVTIELEPERRAAFEGHFSAVAIGCGTLAEMTASSYVVSRTSADIARLAADSLSIGYQIRGPGWMDAGEDRVNFLEEGRFAVSYSDLPYRGTPQRTDGFHFRSLRVPLSAFPDLAKPARQLWGKPAAASPQLENLFSASFAGAGRRGQRLAGSAKSLRHVAQLALLLRGAVEDGHGAKPRRASLRPFSCRPPPDRAKPAPARSVAADDRRLAGDLAAAIASAVRTDRRQLRAHHFGHAAAAKHSAGSQATRRRRYRKSRSPAASRASRPSTGRFTPPTASRRAMRAPRRPPSRKIFKKSSGNFSVTLKGSVTHLTRSFRIRTRLFWNATARQDEA